jgi:hypothetical protein
MVQRFLSRRFRLFAVAVIASILTVLTACGGPPAGPTPSIAIALDSAAASVLRGGSVDVTVTLTRLGGAADPADLTVDGLPAGVSASFAPVTLSGAVLTSTLTLQADAGAAETSADLTVTATSGTLTDDTTLTLDVESLTVTGRVEGLLDLPLSGISVTSQGNSTFTDANGAFTLNGLSTPYDVVLEAAVGGGAIHVFEGMTTAAPVLAPHFAMDIVIGATAYTATIGGDVLGGAAVGADRMIAVCVEGGSVAVTGCEYVFSGDTTYGFDATWYEAGDVTVTVHALHLETAADGTPLAYLGYDSFDLTLSDGAVESEDLALAAVPSLSVTGTIEPGAGVTVVGSYGYVRFGDNLSMAVFESSAVTADFDVLMPEIPGVGYDFLSVGSAPTGATYGWIRGVGADAGTLALPAVPELVAPADAAVNVDLATTFSATGDGGPLTFVWDPDAGGPQIVLTTMRTSVTVPDPALGGYVFPAGANYSWTVLEHGGTTVDDASSRGFVDLLEYVSLLTSGGPRFDEDGALSFTSSRDFQFAP